MNAYIIVPQAQSSNAYFPVTMPMGVQASPYGAMAVYSTPLQNLAVLPKKVIPSNGDITIDCKK